ncbi:DUF2628 domain-containing protein [Aquimarina mytili]|uniref:DUF2628 domain-containing protein n=1 Tax=Aquimarina mytili TaxID=874423 RepID=A0A936ZYQ8_9FLAO|nr:DUF2628 domain-containing protein [Aquimarina mytili]MBL0683611.1 DUF2628 domain-containing protein [Aquimarina mytili]
MKHTEREYQIFFGDNDDYYLDVIQSYDRGRKLRFNPYAFFLGIFWLLYRKMYLTFTFIVVLIFLQAFIEETLYENYLISYQTYNSLDIISRLVWASVLGLFGNKFYQLEVDRKISRVLNENLSEQETKTKLGKVGGTTLIPHLILVLIIGFLMYLFHQGYLDNY